MSSAVRVSNQNRASFMERCRKAKEQAIGDVKRACSELTKVCIYYTNDNTTWRANFDWESKLGSVIEGLLVDYKKEYESYVRIYGISMELTGDGGVSDDDKYITSLTVASGSGNGVSRLELVGFERLKEIRIGDKCFTKVVSFKLDGLSSLEKLVVGEKQITYILLSLIHLHETNFIGLVHQLLHVVLVTGIQRIIHVGKHLPLIEQDLFFTDESACHYLPHTHFSNSLPFKYCPFTFNGSIEFTTCSI